MKPLRPMQMRFPESSTKVVYGNVAVVYNQAMEISVASSEPFVAESLMSKKGPKVRRVSIPTCRKNMSKLSILCSKLTPWIHPVLGVEQSDG